MSRSSWQQPILLFIQWRLGRTDFTIHSVEIIRMDRGAMALFGLIRLGSNLFYYSYSTIYRFLVKNLAMTSFALLRSDPIRAKGSHVFIVFQTGRPARARPEPDLARPYAARHYTARLMFRAGPCRASCLAGGPGTTL
jgi:hypothetical protein